MTEIVIPTVATTATGVRKRVILHYTDADPYAVTLIFTTQINPDTGQPLEWTFARQVLADGFWCRAPKEPVDVEVWPFESDETIAMLLSSPDGVSVITFPRATIGMFLRDAYRLVPRGREHLHLDVDACAERLLAGGSHA